MSFTKNALFPNTQKWQGKKKIPFWQINSNLFFPVLNHNQNKWVFQQNNSQPIFLPSFYIKTTEFWEFANPKKIVETKKKRMELKNTMMIHYEQI